MFLCKSPWRNGFDFPLSLLFWSSHRLRQSHMRSMEVSFFLFFWINQFFFSY
jgi:hypothetical protein